jgi:aspartate aminotransferase-like enzyme
MHPDGEVIAVTNGPLGQRYASTLESLATARETYRLLRSQETVDVRALRKAAKQVYDLEQLQAVLARELAQTRIE